MMHTLGIGLLCCAVTLSSCAAPSSRAPSVEGSVDTVSRAEIGRAIAVAQPYRTDSRGSPARVRRVRVIDRDHVAICFSLQAHIQACDRLERRKSVWRLTGEHEITTPNPLLSDLTNR